MSHRDETLITTAEDATEWLERYRHTITDPQVLRVIEQLELVSDTTTLEDQLESANEQVVSLEARLKRLKDLLRQITDNCEGAVSLAVEASDV